MLSKPQYGWTDFSLEGTSIYGLSYLNDIAFEWLEQAIHGLQTRLPFCVEGYLEPGRFLCIVSYWNCHILIEGDREEALTKEDILLEYSHTSMLDFCKRLYKDISDNIDEWSCFVSCFNEPLDEKKKILQERLTTLKDLIISREDDFGADRCFI